MLASGNLGLVYLMDEPRRMTRGRSTSGTRACCPRSPRTRTSAGLLSALQSTARWCCATGPTTSPTDAWRARIRSRRSRPMRHGISCARTASGHVADIMVGSFYDPHLDEGCAFEELISFHGGLGGPQTEPFVLHPGSPASPTSRSSPLR